MTASFITFPAAQLNGDFTQAKAYEETIAYLQSSPAPDVVYCENDNMCFGVMQALDELGIAYGDGTIGLISNEINYAWTPGSDTAIELAPTWCKDTAVARSPVIYAENGTIALIKVSDRAISTPQLTPEGLPYQRQQTIRELALIPLQDLFSGGQNWTPVAMLDGALFD